MSRINAPLSEVISRDYLPVLDGIRAVSVLIVMLGHWNYPVKGIPADLGVSAFFVLSGFLITRLLMREHARTGDISLRRFYVRRTLRIFPAYYAFLFISFVLDRMQGQIWSTALLTSSLTYTVNYFNAFHHHPSTSVAHAWSLSVEEQFYLLWPLVFLVLVPKGVRALAVVTGVLALCAIAWRSWLTLVANADVAYVYNAFDTRFDNLAVGCLFALIVNRNGVAESLDRVSTRWWYPLVTLSLLTVSRLLTGGAYHYSLGFTVDAVLIAILIVQLLVLHASVPWRWLQCRTVVFLGTISYPMYLYHAWGSSIGHRFPHHTRTAEFLAAVLATIALACASYYIIEQPFLRLKHRLQPIVPAARKTVLSVS